MLRVLTAFPYDFREYLFWLPTTPYLISASWGLAVLVFLLFIMGFWMRIREGCLDAYYFLTYLSVLIVWPYPDELYRFLFPIAPLFVFYAFYSVHRISHNQRIKRYRILPLVPALAAVTLSIMASVGLQARMNRVDDPYRNSTELFRTADEADGLRLAQIMKESMKDMVRIGSTTPEDAVIIGPKANFITLLSGRTAVHLRSHDSTQEHYCQLINNDVNYAYISRITTTYNREGIDAIRHYFPFASPAWRRVDEKGKLQATLFRLDRAKLRRLTADAKYDCHQGGGVGQKARHHTDRQ